MIFDEIKELYEKGDITVKQYGMRMFKEYERLLDYKSQIAKSNISQISITANGVIFTIRNENREKKEYFIDMEVYAEDAAAVPVTILSYEKGYELEELNMLDILLGYIAPKGVFFDIGANLGWYTLNACKLYPDISVYAFEPIEQTYVKMKKNLEINDINNCELFNMGLSDKNGKINFYYDIEASGASSLVDLRENGTTEIVECNVKRIDDIVQEENIERIDIIKCDVEGSELFVYQGGIESIKRFKPIIFSEMLRKWSAKFNYHPNDIIMLFKEAGYGCFVLSGREKLKRLDMVDDNTIETNYFFLHEEKHKNIIQSLC